MLPPHLLAELQEYIAGELVYIPKKPEPRKGWGEVSGARLAIQKRNAEIVQRYRHGATIQELAEAYFLSEDSIRKIVFCRKAK